LIRLSIVALLLVSVALALVSAGAAFMADSRAGVVGAVVTDDKGKPVEDAVVSLTSTSAPASAPHRPRRSSTRSTRNSFRTCCRSTSARR